MPTVPPQDDGLTTFILTIVMLVICWPTVVTRFWLRVKMGAFGLDDWLMGLGLIMTTAWSGVLISYCYSGGGYDPSDPLMTPQLISRALQLYFICQSVYCPTTIPIKISICVALLRISGTNALYRWSLFSIMGISTVAGLGSMVGIVASCSPPSAFWDPESGGKCNAMVNTFAAYFISACSILTDFGLAFLPAFMLWNVQLQRSIKVSVTIILGFAAFASCATIVRLRYLLALLDTQNFLLQSAKIAIWTVVELAIGIFAGSAPALRPLLRHIPFLSHSESHQGASSRGRRSKMGLSGRGEGDLKMSSFKAEASRSAKASGTLAEDGSSQEFILDGKDGQRTMQIRKDVSVSVETTNGGTEDWDVNRQYY